MMVSAMTAPTAKKAAPVPTRMAPSRSTDRGMNGSAALITRQANKAHSAAEVPNSANISGDAQP